jgi:hypothetical protein
VDVGLFDLTWKAVSRISEIICTSRWKAFTVVPTASRK